jgi:four helix bundle protein
VLPTLPRGFGFLADQLRRAAASVPLNYLEGCGRSGAAERRQFFRIAIGSAHEVAATLDVMHRFGVLAESDRAAGQDLCDHLVAMLRRFR